jgi:hypothetical protein
MSAIRNGLKDTWEIPLAAYVEGSQMGKRGVRPDRRGGGWMPAAHRISSTVDGARFAPSLVSSPWIRR